MLRAAARTFHIALKLIGRDFHSLLHEA